MQSDAPTGGNATNGGHKSAVNERRKTMAKKNYERRDWTKEIAEKFAKMLEENIVPWVRPWDLWKSWSGNTGNDYRGVNQLLLTGGEFLTFNQVKAKGGHVNKGAKGLKVIFYDKYTRKTEVENENGEKEIILEPSRFLKAYTVFSVNDTDLEPKYTKDVPTHEWDSIEKAEEIIKAYCDAYGITITHGSNEAFNSQNVFGKNEVVLPRREQFKDAVKYYATVFHELTHSTSKMCGRDLSNYGTNKKARAREELVAEIGSAYIMSFLGLNDKMQDMNSAAYMKSWAKNLKDDNASIMYATPKAIEAGDLILGALSQSAEAPAEEPKEEPKKSEYTKGDAKILEKTLRRVKTKAFGKVLETSKGYLTCDGYKAYLLKEKVTDADFTDGAPEPVAEELLKCFEEKEAYSDVFIDMDALKEHIKENNLKITTKAEIANKHPFKFMNGDVECAVNAVWFRDMLTLLDTKWVRVSNKAYCPVYVNSEKGKGVILPIRCQ